MTRSPIFHVGIIVPRLEEARHRLTSVLGTEWGPVVVNDAMPLRTGSGEDITVRSRLCYSTEPPYLELIEECPGTSWVCNPYSNLHHIGFFTPDLMGNSEALIGLGCPLELAGRTGDQVPVTFTLHRDDIGIRIEHLDEVMRPVLEKRMCRKPDPS